MSELIINNKNVYTEVYKILINLTENELKKIPSSLIQGLKEKMNLNYNFVFDINKPLECQNISDEAKLMLAVIFRDYLATEEQRKKILTFEKNKELQIEQEAREKYDIDVFKNNKIKKAKDETIEKEMQLVKYEEKWYIKLFNCLIDFIKKSK